MLGNVLAVLLTAVTVSPMTRTTVASVRVVTSENVDGIGSLTVKRWGQVAEGEFLKGSGAMLATNGWMILDYGRELHGSVVLGCGAKSGHDAKVHVRFGESVSEALAPLGERGACNDHAIRDDVISLPWYGKREIGTTGFRFVYVANAGKEPVQIEFANAISIMRDMKPVGSFRCSDERLNKIFETAVRTAQLCCQDYLWDGIKRDRLVWIGDFHPELQTIGSVFGGDAVLRDSLKYAIDTTPTNTWMNTMPTYTCWFMRDVYGYFMLSGDDIFCRMNCPYLTATANRLADMVGPNGEYLLPGTFLDWPTKYDPEAEKAGARALLAITLDECAYLMDVFHEPETATKCKEAAARLRKIVPDPHGKKTAAALLALGGFAEPKKMFDQYLSKNGCEGVSTFYGYYVLEAMSAAGENRRALETIRDYWGGMLDMGATSFWEDFNLAWTNNAFRIDQMPVKGMKDIHGDYGDFCYAGFRHSLCHGWSSGPAAWLINHVLGLRPLEPGGYVMDFRPDLAGLDWAEGSIATEFGPVSVSIKKNAKGDLVCTVSAPKEVQVRDWRIVAVDQATSSAVIVDGAPGASTNVLWRWCPKDDPGIKPDDVRAFNNIDECKVIDGGKTILVNASWEGVAGIDVASGRAKWYSVMSPEIRGAGPHSLTMLPDGCVAVAVSTGADVVELVDVRGFPFDPSKQERKRLFPLAGAHGIVYDEGRKTVFALGYTNLVEFAYDSVTKSATIQRTWNYVAECGDAWGHDLVPDGEGGPRSLQGYYFTNHSGVWHFDPASGKFESARQHRKVKSFSRSELKGDLIATPRESWWTDRLTLFQPDGTERIIGPFAGARFYKARWFF